MKLMRIIPPDKTAVSLSEARTYLRIDSVEELEEQKSVELLRYKLWAEPDTYHGTPATAGLGCNPVISIKIGKLCACIRPNTEGKPVVHVHENEDAVDTLAEITIEESDRTVATAWEHYENFQCTRSEEVLHDPVLIPYHGDRRYVRVRAKVFSALTFGASFFYDAKNQDDDLLGMLMWAASENVEHMTQRALLTQTWRYIVEKPPGKEGILLPLGNLQRIDSIRYRDEDEVILPDYVLEKNGDGFGAIIPKQGIPWQPLGIDFVCGWQNAFDVPAPVRTAILMVVGDLYENREAQMAENLIYRENQTVRRLLAPYRLWGNFP